MGWTSFKIDQNGQPSRQSFQHGAAATEDVFSPQSVCCRESGDLAARMETHQGLCEPGTLGRGRGAEQARQGSLDLGV
jgi:hypothetical protein